MASSQTAEKPWHSFLTIDLLLQVANKTFLHPFVAWIIPLCLRAQAASFRHTSMQLALAYAIILTLLSILSVINKRIAYGLPREVDLSEEVIVITGGASGLGLLIAEVYGMRGASVAVLDVREMESKEAIGVEFYNCDVGDRVQVEKVAVEIEKDVCLVPIHYTSRKGALGADDWHTCEARHAHYLDQQCWHCEWQVIARFVSTGNRKVNPHPSSYIAVPLTKLIKYSVISASTSSPTSIPYKPSYRV